MVNSLHVVLCGWETQKAVSPDKDMGKKKIKITVQNTVELLCGVLKINVFPQVRFSFSCPNFINLTALSFTQAVPQLVISSSGCQRNQKLECFTVSDSHLALSVLYELCGNATVT